MSTWELRHTDTGIRIHVGDILIGRDGKPAVVSGFEPPHKPSASGRILFEDDRLYAHSVGCEYIRVPDARDRDDMARESEPT